MSLKHARLRRCLLPDAGDIIADDAACSMPPDVEQTVERSRTRTATRKQTIYSTPPSFFISFFLHATSRAHHYAAAIFKPTER